MKIVDVHHRHGPMPYSGHYVGVKDAVELSTPPGFYASCLCGWVCPVQRSAQKATAQIVAHVDENKDDVAPWVPGAAFHENPELLPMLRVLEASGIERADLLRSALRYAFEAWGEADEEWCARMDGVTS